MSISATEPAGLIEGRECGSCVSCCSFFTIAELDKPAGRLCSHSCLGGGCDIYPDRPRACRVFYCAYRVWDEVPEDWRPDKTGFILGGQLAAGRFLSVTADPALPQSWRDGRYYPMLREWARRGVKIGSLVVVFVGQQVIIIQPEGEHDLGVVASDEVLISEERMTLNGPVREVSKVKRDDPRAQRRA